MNTNDSGFMFVLGMLVGILIMVLVSLGLLQSALITRNYLIYADKMCGEPANDVFIDGDFNCSNGLEGTYKENKND